MRLVRDKNFYRTILRISLPTAFSSLVSFLVVVADDIMVSSITNGVTEGYGKIAQAAHRCRHHVGRHRNHAIGSGQHRPAGGGVIAAEHAEILPAQ